MLKGILLSLISASAYATLPVLARLGYDNGLSTVNMLTYRFMFGALTLVILFTLFRRKALKPNVPLILKCAGLGIGLYMMQSYFFFKAVEYIPASTTALLLYLYPLVVLIESTVFLKIKFRIASIISVILILLGCCLVFYDAFQRELNLTGILFGLAAPLTFGTYLTLSQVVLKNDRPGTVALYMSLFTGLGYMVANGGVEMLSLTAPQLSIAVALGIIPSAIAILTLYIAIDLIGATYVSLFSSIEPAITLILAGILLSENIVIFQIFGVIFLIAGIVLPNLSVIKRRSA